MVTITDVAHRAGVSMKTVSRVLNNEAHVRPAVREKVQSAVAALGYRPNLAARQLAGHKSFIIGYPFNNPSAAYVTDILLGAARACRDRGYHLVSEPVDLLENAVEIIDRLISTLRPDGMILIPPLAEIPAVIDQIEKAGLPLVRIAGSAEGYGEALRIDDADIARQMVAHLAEQGHQRIAFIRPPAHHSQAASRFDGYCAGLSAAGIAFDPSIVVDGAFDVESGMAAARTLLDLPEAPTAIFASNDQMALGALRVAHQRKLDVPGNVAIAGFDDLPASAFAWPPLTTVRQPIEALGACAARMLLGEEPDDAALTHQLILRESTLSLTA